MATILEDTNFKNVTQDLEHQKVDEYFKNLRYYDGDSVSEMVFSSFVVIGLEKGMSKEDKDKYAKILINALPENTVKMIQDEVVEKGKNENENLWEKLRKCLANIDKLECAVEPIPTIIKDQPEASSSKSNELTEETGTASTANIQTSAQGKIPSMEQPKSEGGTSKTIGQIVARAPKPNERKKEVKKPSEPPTKESEISSKLASQGEEDPIEKNDLPLETIIENQPEASSSKTIDLTEETETAPTASANIQTSAQGKIPSMEQPQSEGGTSKTIGQIVASASKPNEHKEEVKEPSEPTTEESEISQGEDDPTEEKVLLPSNERMHLTKTDKKEGNLSKSQERDKTESAATFTAEEQILYPKLYKKSEGQFLKESCFIKPELNAIRETLRSMPDNAVTFFRTEYVTSFSRVRKTLKRHLHEKISIDKAESTENIQIKNAFVSSIYGHRDKSVTDVCYHYIHYWVNVLISNKFMSSEEFIDVLMLKIPYKYLLYLEETLINNKWESFTTALGTIEQIDGIDWKPDPTKAANLAQKSITQRAVLQSKYILEYINLRFEALSILDFSQDCTDSLTIHVTINDSVNISYTRLLYFVFMDEETKFSQDQYLSLESFIQQWSRLQSKFQFMKLWNFLEVLLDKLPLADLEACNALINYTNLKRNEILKINPKYINKFSKDYVVQGFKYLNLLEYSSMSNEMFLEEYENRCCLKCYNSQDVQKE